MNRVSGRKRYWREEVPTSWEPWLTLHHIIGGVNVSSGYEYFAFGYRTNDREE